jgi:hypothetical protein
MHLAMGSINIRKSMLIRKICSGVNRPLLLLGGLGLRLLFCWFRLGRWCDGLQCWRSVSFRALGNRFLLNRKAEFAAGFNVNCCEGFFILLEIFLHGIAPLTNAIFLVGEP